MSKMHHNFSSEQRISLNLGDSHTVGGGLSCLWKNQEVSDLGGTAFLVSCAQPTLQTSGTDYCGWKSTPRKYAIGGISTHHILETANGEPQTHERRWVPEVHFIHPIRLIKIRVIQRYRYVYL